MFKEELEKVCGIVERIIREDDFSDAITPPYLRETVRDYPLRKGKRLRPALLMWSCGLLDGNPENAKFAAAAVEIYHNWTLVHDDIIDNDDFRRGTPTSHCKIAKFAARNFKVGKNISEKFGRDMAMLAGDIQQGWAVAMMLKSVGKRLIPPETGILLARKMQVSAGLELISGEALDIEFTFRKNKVSSDEIENMYSLKTGALLRFCAEAGAIISTNNDSVEDKARTSKIGDFAATCGIAFQLKDDWLGIYGDEKTIGKPACSDFSERKPTYIFMKALELASKKDRNFLLGMLGKKRYSSGETGEIRNLISVCGAEKETLSRAEKLKSSAIEILLAFKKTNYRTLLVEWAEFVLQRIK